MSAAVTVRRTGGGGVTVDRTAGPVKVVRANDIGPLVATTQAAAGAAAADAAAAAASAASASDSAGIAVSSASAAAGSETDAASSAAAAAGSAASASADAAAATGAASTAVSNAAAASTSAAHAATSEANAAASAGAAAASAASIALPIAVASGGTGATTAANARTNLGLGTAAVANTGTSGAVLPLLNGNNTYSGTATFTGGAGAPISAQWSDNGGGVGPEVQLYRISASPAAADLIGRLSFRGHDSTNAALDYARITAIIDDATDTSEDGRIAFGTVVAGTQANRVHIGAGLYTEGATGADRGADTINATTLYEAGTALQSKYARIGTANTFTAAQSITGSASGLLNLTQSDDGAAVGPVINLIRVSNSPAAADIIGGITFYGRDSAGNQENFGTFQVVMADPTNGSEDTRYEFVGPVAGSAVYMVRIADGVLVGSATGGHQGTGTLNATALYEQGTAISAKYAALAGASFTGQVLMSGGSGTPLSLSWNDAGAAFGPGLVLYRDSGSPAAADEIGGVTFRGRDSAGNQNDYAGIRAIITDAADGSEDSEIGFRTQVAATSAYRLKLGAGLYTAGATGGDKGVDTINVGTYYQNGVAQREVLGANRTYYVATTGSDSNNGLTVGAPFATLQKAINVVAALDISIYDVTIQVAAGTYTTGCNVNGPWTGSGTVSLVGDTTTPANCVISTTSFTCITAQNGARLSVGGIKFQTGTSQYGIRALTTGRVTVTGKVDFGACASGHTNAGAFGVIVFQTAYNITGSAPFHWYSTSQGRIEARFINPITLTGTPAFGTAFARADAASAIVCDGNTFSGSATGPRYQSTDSSIISTGGAGTTYLPGNAAGTGTNPSASPYGSYT